MPITFTIAECSCTGSSCTCGAALRASPEQQEIERLRADLRQIETIANIAPADERHGSLAVRMNKVWLLARGN